MTGAGLGAGETTAVPTGRPVGTSTSSSDSPDDEPLSISKFSILFDMVKPINGGRGSPSVLIVIDKETKFLMILLSNDLRLLLPNGVLFTLTNFVSSFQASDLEMRTSHDKLVARISSKFMDEEAKAKTQKRISITSLKQFQTFITVQSGSPQTIPKVFLCCSLFVQLFVCLPLRTCEVPFQKLWQCT